MNEPSENALDAYIRENRLKYSEPALRQAAIAAGNSPEAVDAALARHRPDPTAGAERRAASLVLRLYLVGFVLLTVAMLLNAASSGFNSYGGIGIAVVVWGIVVLLGYGAARIWIASRRVGLIVVGVVLALSGLATLGSGGPASMLSFLGGFILVVAAIVLGSRMERQLSNAMPILLAVPVLIILALGGACVATGLPFGGYGQ